MPKFFLLIASQLVLGSGYSTLAESWTPPSPIRLATLIEEDPAAAAGHIRKSWGREGLENGGRQLTEKTTVLFAAIAEEPLSAAWESGDPIGSLVTLNDEGLQALAIDLGNIVDSGYQLLKPTGEVFGKGRLRIEYYPPAPESLSEDGVPEGILHRHLFNQSKAYPDTTRELDVYIPAQYDGKTPAALIVFQDGLRHADRSNTNGLRAANVLDHLIHSQDIPTTIGLFVNPGRFKDQDPKAKPRNRSVEYDSLGDSYVSFLLDEIIPFAIAEHDLVLSDDPKQWAIAGGSSGCAAAWTAAWERPDKFGKVLGWVGTFVDIRGAHNYPPMVRKSDPKPIRAALLGERNDLDNQFGNWPLANLQMEAALKFAGYDYRYWWGDGFHGSRHAAVMLPEMLRWLWSE